jgi:hypothetical protein
MNIFKNKENKELFGINGFTEDELVAEYNIHLNYKPYIEQILHMPDKQLLLFAPNSSAQAARDNLKLQLDTCIKFIEMYGKTLNLADTKKRQN